MESRVTESSCFRLESAKAIVSQLAQKDKVPWHRKRNLRSLYLLMLPACLGVEMSSGYDGSMVNGLLAVPSWLEYYHYPHAVALGLMISMYSLGAFAAVPFAPFVVDKVGRRSPILLGGVLSICGGVLQGFALDSTMFITARFIVGFANTFSVVAASALIAELSYPKERAVLSGLFTAFYYVGAIVAAAVTLETFSMSSNWGWRIPSLLQIVPSLLQVSLICFIPESPRWLVSQGRGIEALSILVEYHGEGDKNSEFVLAEYAQISESLEVGSKIFRMNWKKMISGGMQKRMIITIFIALCTPLSGLSLISHFLPPILDTIGIHDHKTKNIINLANSGWKLANGIIIVLIATRYPRRTMYLACTISLFAVFAAFTTASADYSVNHSKLSAQVVLALIFLHSPAYNLAFGSLDLTYLTELFPFHVRASGIALCQWWSRFASFVTQFINPVGIDAAGWKWYIVYCVWNAFQVVFVYLVFPETSGRTLEELTFLFEEDREALEHGQTEPLRGHGGHETYGATHDQPARPRVSEQA